MIQIYKPGNINYEMNGDSVLNPLSCSLNMILNASWDLELQHPIDDRIKYLIPNAVISLDTPIGEKQLFRINTVDKNDDYIICTAYPIFFDSRNDCFLFDSRPTNKNGQEALDIMLASNNKYTAQSNIKDVKTSYYIQKNFMESLNGDDENSFINRWGGEISYNNYEITVNDRIGRDNGLRAEFGFNLNGISEKIDMTNVVTRIVPKAFNGYLLPDNETVDSPNISKYPVVYTRVVEYPGIKMYEDASGDNESDDVVVCKTHDELYEQLRKHAKKEFEGGIDLPAITYNVDMVDLSKTDEYKNYTDLLKVNLGDDVYIKHRRLDITTKARVIELVYDCCTNTVDSLVLGDYESNYFDDVESVTESAKNVIDTDTNTVIAEKIKGVLDLMNTSLKAQKTIAKKQDVRAILFEDLDPESPTHGALCIGTKGIEIAGKRNETDSDWMWGTAIDFQTIYANYIIAGILSDKKGNNYWDLDKGELVTKNMKATNASFTGIVKSSTIEGGDIKGSNISTDKDVTIGRNINFSGNGNYAVIMGNNTVLRFLSSNPSTTSVDGTNIQLLASNRIHISGSTVSSSVPITINSDKRLKRNIKDIDLSDIVDILKIKAFDYKNGKQNVVGIVAQDIIEHPLSMYILNKNYEGIYSVDYNSLAMACIQKVQKMNKKINILEEKLSDKNKDKRFKSFM